MAKLFKRGSQWRKWDLHFHTPSSYDYADRTVTNKDIVRILKENGVRAVAVTDHNTIDVDRIKELNNEAGNDVVFFPGIELCTESRGDDPIHITAIFPENSDITYIWKILEVKLNLSEQKKSGKKSNELYCGLHDASDEIHKLGGMVLIHAGSKSNSIEEITNSLPVKMAEKKDIVEYIDVFEMGQEKDLEDYRKMVFPFVDKIFPMIMCSDNHNINKYSVKQNLWIKADLTFEGLRQILIEPEDRIFVGAVKPDEKDSYKVIDRVVFSDTKDFPSEIVFNSNLCSIIGSRSSGKSALLNYMAHAVDKSYVESQLKGPAAKFKWDNLPLNCSVVWANGSIDGAGKIVFLEQGYLSGISDKPSEITEKIKPVLFRKYPKIKAEFDSAENSISSCNKSIESNVKRWFLTMKVKKILKEEIGQIGDKEAIVKAKDDYQRKIDELKVTALLTDKEIEAFQKVSSDLTTKKNSLALLTTSSSNLIAEYFNPLTKESVDFVVEYSSNPSFENFPADLKTIVEDRTTKTSKELATDIKKLVTLYRSNLDTKITSLSNEIEEISKSNKTLIDKNKQNQELVALVEGFNKQEGLLVSIKEKEAKIASTEEVSRVEMLSLSDNLILRKNAIQSLEESFSSVAQGGEIVFGVECRFNDVLLDQLSEMYNLREVKDSTFIEGGVVNVTKTREQYVEFLSDINTEKIKLKNSETPQNVAIQTLTFSEEIRFTAIMEGDSIGGFGESSMTPGKQALFALTLILDESDDAWPLLIDQPEDDLDSRSIYDTVADFFKHKKKERQIIMVSHNANLVIGADSEQIIVANKHGEDRRNKDGRLFDYLTGSLENTGDRKETGIVLEDCGIREHACDILEGGEAAFYKREQKYKLGKKGASVT